MIRTHFFIIYNVPVIKNMSILIQDIVMVVMHTEGNLLPDSPYRTLQVLPNHGDASLHVLCLHRTHFYVLYAYTRTETYTTCHRCLRSPTKWLLDIRCTSQGSVYTHTPLYNALLRAHYIHHSLNLPFMHWTSSLPNHETILYVVPLHK